MKTINLSFTHLLLGLAILVGFPAVFNEGYRLGHYEMASLHQRAMVREANRELAGKNIQTESEAFTALGIQNGRWNSAYKWTKETGVALAETPMRDFLAVARLLLPVIIAGVLYFLLLAYADRIAFKLEKGLSPKNPRQREILLTVPSVSHRVAGIATAGFVVAVFVFASLGHP
jgi:hypothetical protein